MILKSDLTDSGVRKWRKSIRLDIIVTQNDLSVDFHAHIHVHIFDSIIIRTEAQCNVRLHNHLHNENIN